MFSHLPAMIRINGTNQIEFKTDEVSDGPGREMTPHLFEVCTSTHYKRMVKVDDNTVVLFGSPAGTARRRQRPTLRGIPGMYKTSDGEEVFIIDGHVHLWDGSRENQLNVHGEQFISCFYGYHAALSPKHEVWEREKFYKYGPETMYHDLFVDGPDDMAIFQPTLLSDFYKIGFNSTEQNAALKEKHPDRFILNGAFDPRDGERGLDALEALVERHQIKGVKLYTAEWRGDSRGYKLHDPWAERYLAHAERLGIKNIHVHKGPTILPLDRDAFDVADIDHAATNFPNLNFIVEHCGLPRLDDFCWIGVQEPNVYGGLAVVMPFIHGRPGYFAHVMSELLFWLGEDRLLFASDYAIWKPQWLVEKFMAFELPDDVRRETGVDLTPTAKRKILGLNAAKLYGIDVEQQKAKLRRADLGTAQ